MASSFIVTTADWSRGATLTWRRPRVPAVTLSRAVTRTGVVADSLCHGSVASHHISSRVTCHVCTGRRPDSDWGPGGRPSCGVVGAHSTAQHSTTAPQHSTLNSTLRLGPAQHSTHVMTTRGWFQLHHTTSHNCEYSTAGLGLVARCGGR